MNISQAGLDAIKRHEGLRLKAYPDPASGGEPWTIGYGHTSGVSPGMEITREMADEFLRADVAACEQAIRSNVTVPITQGQFDAMCSLAFNIGTGAFARSTLVKRLNAGDVAGAAQEFVRWNQAAGQVNAGLTRRRAAEREMFLGDVAAPVAEVGHSEQPRTVMAPLPIITALLPSLLEAIPKLGQLFAKSDNDKRNVKAAEEVFKVAKEALGAVNEQEVVQRVQADPEAVKAVSQAVEEKWYTLTQEVGGGIAAARQADAAFTSGEARFWHSPAFWITAMLLPLVYIATYAVLLKGGFSSDIQAMVLGAIFGGLLTGGISSFWFGTSASSQRKTELMAK